MGKSDRFSVQASFVAPSLGIGLLVLSIAGSESACSSAPAAGDGGAGGASGSGGGSGSGGSGGSSGESAGDCTVHRLAGGETWFNAFGHDDTLVVYDAGKEATHEFSLAPASLTKKGTKAVGEVEREGYSSPRHVIGADADYIYADEGSSALPAPSTVGRARWATLDKFEPWISTNDLPPNFEFTDVGKTYAIVTRTPTDMEPRRGVGVVASNGKVWTADLPARPEGIMDLLVNTAPGDDLVFSTGTTLTRTPIDKYTPTILFEATVPTSVADRTPFGIVKPNASETRVFFRFIAPKSAAMGSGLYMVPKTGGAPKRIGESTDIVVPVDGKLVGASGSPIGAVPQTFFEMNEDGTNRRVIATCGDLKEGLTDGHIVVTTNFVVVASANKIILAKRK